MDRSCKAGKGNRREVQGVCGRPLTMLDVSGNRNFSFNRFKDSGIVPEPYKLSKRIPLSFLFHIFFFSTYITVSVGDLMVALMDFCSDTTLAYMKHIIVYVT